MLSIIIPTRESERALVRTLAALVPGSLEGLIREVIVADAGSQDDTAAVADIAGCKFELLPGDLGERLSAAAAKAKSDWLLFLQPGVVLTTGWVTESSRFLEGADAAQRRIAAVFRSATNPENAPLREALVQLGRALGGRPRPHQGLLIAKSLYVELGGHDAKARDPERELLRRLGRQRIVTLNASAVMRI